MNLTRATFLFLGLFFIAACSKEEAKKRPEPAPAPVMTAKAEAKNIPVKLQVVGRAEAYESVAVKSRVDGQVESVLFAEGQHVKQGDVLVKLDVKDFAARLQQAEALASRDAATTAKTRADTARYAALRDKNFVSEEKVNEVKTNEAVALANLNASKAASELARLQLSYATIRAPISGITGARVVFPGSSVKTNDTTLVVINRVTPLLVNFSVPEKHLHKLNGIRSPQTEKIKVDLTVPGDTKHHLEGEIVFVDNAVDASTGTILMKASLPNQDEKITPGQFLQVNILLENLTDAVSVPNEAIQQADNGNFVFVIKPDQTAEVRKVVVAASDGKWTALKEGIQVGETVVIDGQLRLSPGAKVREVSGQTEQDKTKQASNK